MFNFIGDFWYQITGFIQDLDFMQGIWETLIGLPVIGTILGFLEATFGRA